MSASYLSLYLVADPEHCDRNLVETVADAISGGVTCVQLRAKSLTDREVLALALSLRDVCRRGRIPFIVNDRLDIALAARADGVHLGVDDLPTATARSFAPDGFIIGFSPETDDQIRASAESGVDYLGVGPVYATRTKGDAGNALGLEELRRRCELSPVPVVGIGGITAFGASDVIRAGAKGIAVVSAILRSDQPALAARELRSQSGT